MTLRRLRDVAGAVCVLTLGSCDPIVYARATTPLVAPLDSVCLKGALSRRLGPPSIQPVMTRRTGTRAAELTFYYGHASFTQNYPDSGQVSLTATEPIAGGHQALAGAGQSSRDSVTRSLGQDLLAVRDACGGKSPPGVPDLRAGS